MYERMVQENGTSCTREMRSRYPRNQDTAERRRRVISKVNLSYHLELVDAPARVLICLRSSSQTEDDMARNTLTTSGSNCRPDQSSISFRAASIDLAGR